MPLLSQGLASLNSAIPLDRPGTTRSSLHLQGKRRAALPCRPNWMAMRTRFPGHVSSRPHVSAPHPETREFEVAMLEASPIKTRATEETHFATELTAAHGLTRNFLDVSRHRRMQPLPGIAEHVKLDGLCRIPPGMERRRVGAKRRCKVLGRSFNHRGISK